MFVCLFGREEYASCGILRDLGLDGAGGNKVVLFTFFYFLVLYFTFFFSVTFWYSFLLFGSLLPFGTLFYLMVLCYFLVVFGTFLGCLFLFFSLVLFGTIWYFFVTVYLPVLKRANMHRGTWRGSRGILDGGLEGGGLGGIIWVTSVLSE